MPQAAVDHLRGSSPAAAAGAASSASGVPDIALEALVAGYETPVVGPLTLRIASGTTVALWGPNGSGKSTVLNVIGGSAHTFGGTLVRRPGLRVSHQHQNPLPIAGLPLSGRELFGLTGADPGAVPPAAARLLGQRLSRLSGGQLHLLQVLACLMAPVDLVLLDEPTNNVDREGVALIEQFVRAGAGRKSVLLVSHDRRFVEALADEIVDMPVPEAR